jgi:outer membrane protein
MSIVDSTLIKGVRKVALGLGLAALTLPAGAQEAFSLKDCIAYGLQHHPSVQVARNNVEQARQNSREAVSAYLPQLNVTGGMDYNMKLPTTIIPAGAFSPEETRLSFGNKYASTVTAQAEQQIYNQSLLTGIKASRPNQQIAQLSEAQNRQTIIYNVSDAYFRMITAQKQLELLQANEQKMARLLRIAQLQAEAGVAKKVDVKQVQVNYNNVVAQISTAQNNLQLATNQLKYAMGLYNDQPIVLTDTARWLQHTPQVKALPTFSFKQTLDYRIQEQQIELYDLNAKSIRAGYLPVLSAYGRYGLNGFGNELGDIANRQFDFSTIGLKLSWSLFDGFRRDAQYQKAVISRENARLNLELLEAGQNLQYQNATSQLSQARNSLQTNRENLALASEVYDNTGLQYRQGVGSLSDLLNAESALRDAQNLYLQSLIQFYLAQLDLDRTNSNLETYFTNL